VFKLPDKIYAEIHRAKIVIPNNDGSSNKPVALNETKELSLKFVWVSSPTNKSKIYPKPKAKKTKWTMKITICILRATISDLDRSSLEDNKKAIPMMELLTKSPNIVSIFFTIQPTDNKEADIKIENMKSSLKNSDLEIVILNSKASYSIQNNNKASEPAFIIG
jgi:hypothetical protein